MIVAGVMSGTSADGINVAIVRLSSRGRGLPRHTLLAHEECAYPAPVRRTILEMMNAQAVCVADLARLNFLLGELYADAIAKTARRHRVKIDLVGCHGQTLYHQGVPERFLGRRLAVTWQTGEGAVIAARLAVPVVSDFRPADMAAGGRGAPLVPYLDYLLYRDARDSRRASNRIAQNIGGIANLTAIPAGEPLQKLIAFDTGPGNMVIDAVMEKLFNKRYDRDGKVAASGRVLHSVIAQLLRAPFFRQKPPRTAGREEFGREYAARFLQHCGSTSKSNMVATATFLTTQSIADAIDRFVLPRFSAHQKRNAHALIVSGGGAKNPTLIAMLRDALEPLAIQLHFSDEFGIPSEAKEAVAFALLAYETWHRRPSNVPAATGAKHPAILGKISYA
jgi:anhydro-N-acetylmuramic acid kinase